MSPLLAAAVLTISATLASFPQTASPDLSGTWELSVTTLRGPEIAMLTFKKAGDKYTGIATRGSEQASAEATLEGKAVTIVVTAQMQSGPATFTFTGEVTGDTMSGTAELGSRGSGQPWSAKRAATAVDVSGTWSIEVDTGQGTGTPSFTFKQEGDKLSGQYKGLFGEAPVTGTIKANAIEFWVDVTVEGTSVRVSYSGTVEKDTMKGKVALGDFGEGTFKGTRK
jgi:hypothetical protein